MGPEKIYKKDIIINNSKQNIYFIRAFKSAFTSHILNEVTRVSYLYNYVNKMLMD